MVTLFGRRIILSGHGINTKSSLFMIRYSFIGQNLFNVINSSNSYYIIKSFSLSSSNIKSLEELVSVISFDSGPHFVTIY